MLNKKILVVILLLIAGALVCAFQTPGNKDEAFVFAVVGDLQQPPDSGYLNITRKTIEQIAASPAEFLVITGDLCFERVPSAEKARQKWAEFDKLVQPIRDKGKRIYAALGNHDAKGQRMPQEFIDRFGSRYQVIIEHKTPFVLLDSEASGTSMKNWDLGEKQLEWLKMKPWLPATGGPGGLVFVFLHRPIYRSELMKADPSGIFGPDKPELAQLLEELGVSAVFSAHEHLFEKREAHGIEFYISGGGGGRLLPTGFYHYLLVTANPNQKTFKVKAVKVN